MSTVYIDVFFFINFTVDILALLLTVRLLRIKSNIRRIIFVSLLGAAVASVDLFITDRITFSALSAIFFLLVGIFIAKGITVTRRIKAVAAFLVCEIMIGGTVSLGYTLLDKYLGKYLSEVEGKAENRGALIFALIILFTIGVFRLLMFLFSGTVSEKSVKLRIEIEGQSIEAEALVDSGNLVRDPMNMYPVVFIKKRLAKKIIPGNVIDLTDIDALGEEYKKRIRLIPISRGGATHVFTAVRPDTVIAVDKNCDMGVTVAIDKEEGSYGGFDALVPSAALENVY